MTVREGGVNDMYIQTEARAHRPKGRENTRENKAKWEARSCRRNSTEMCLGSSDDSQSSCLLASRFPSLDAAPTVSVSRPLSFRLPLLAHSLFLSLSLSLSLSPSVSLRQFDGAPGTRGIRTSRRDVTPPRLIASASRLEIPRLNSFDERSRPFVNARVYMS